MLKRLFDIFVSMIGLIILLPVLLIIGVSVFFKDGSPIFFKQRRVGLKGKFFYLYKFRTMRNSIDKDKKLATSNDSRITKLGKFLRNYKLDELPQLINVLLGDISLVGYRPEIPYYVKQYTKEQKAILHYKPGIVDPATLLFSKVENEILANSENIEKDYIEKILPKKIKLSLEYAKKATFLSDMVCLFKCFVHITGFHQKQQINKTIFFKTF